MMLTPVQGGFCKITTIFPEIADFFDGDGETWALLQHRTKHFFKLIFTQDLLFSAMKNKQIQIQIRQKP